jgi:DUF971 family protein
VHPTEIYQPTPSTLVIEWQGGKRSAYAVGALRRACPCTECSTRARMNHGGYVPLLSEQATAVVSIDLIGSSGLHIVWGDGHDKTILRWSWLLAASEDTLSTEPTSTEPTSTEPTFGKKEPGNMQSSNKEPGNKESTH